MEKISAYVAGNTLVVLAVLAAIGLVAVLVGFPTMTALAGMAAGLVIMWRYGRKEPAAAQGPVRE
jgi:hypothetical protein